MATHQEHLHGPFMDDIVPYLGVPGYVLTTFSPYFAGKARKHPILFNSIVAALVIMSTMLAASKYLGSWTHNVLDLFVCSVRIRGEDILHEAFVKWLGEKGHGSSSSILEGQSAAHCRRTSCRPLWWSSKHKGSKLIRYQPLSGFHFWHNWRLFRIVDVRDKSQKETWIQTYGFSTQPIKQILDQVWDWRLKHEASRITPVWHAWEGSWEYLASKRVRSLSTIDLADSVIQPLIKDIADFLSDKSEAQYAARGVPYRRGYLFHGPPGTGKSSLTLALAGCFNLDIQVVSLADPELSDSKMARLFTWLENPSILLLEDIDSAGLTREFAAISVAATGSKNKYNHSHNNDDDDEDSVNNNDNDNDGDRSSNTKLTLSGLLNALDGVGAPEDCIVVMTTNHPEALDPALIRPGRVDYRLEFQNADKGIARKAFMRLTDLEDELRHGKLSDEFAAKVPEGQLSPAELQGYLLGCDSCPRAALAGVDAWVENVLAERSKQSMEENGSIETADEPLSTDIESTDTEEQDNNSTAEVLNTVNEVPSTKKTETIHSEDQREV